MGVQPRQYSMTDDMTKSPRMSAATSPASSKRRFEDVVLSSEKRKSVSHDDAEEAELHERVSFKRSKCGDDELRLVVRTSPSHEEEAPLASPTNEASTPKSKQSPSKTRPNMSASQTITLDMLRPHFEKPLAQVAQIFSICVTLLKKICRKNGLARWPHRQIIGLRKSISSMEQAIGHFEGPRRESYAQQLEKQRNKLTALLEDPTKCNLLAVEDDYSSQVVPAYESAATPTHHQHPAQPMYSQYTRAPLPQAYERPYVPYPQPEYHHPRMYHQPVQHDAYAVQHEAYPRHHDGYPQPGYQPASYNVHPQTFVQRPPPTVSLPPLRIENRQTLPSLSTVVGRRW